MERSFERQIVPAPVVSTLVGQRLRPLVSAERTEDVEDNAGYSWPSLMVGSEGTLGIITSVLVRLVARRDARVASLFAVAGPDEANGACNHAPATRPVAGGRGRLLRRGRHARRAHARRRATPASATRTLLVSALWPRVAWATASIRKPRESFMMSPQLHLHRAPLHVPPRDGDQRAAGSRRRLAWRSHLRRARVSPGTRLCA